MKRIIGYVAILVMMICLTGCIQMDTSITIKRNGKMDVKLLYAMMDMSGSSEGETSSATLSDEQKKSYLDEGWEIEDYSSSGYTGFVIKKNDVDISDLNNTINKTSENINQKGKIDFEQNGMKYDLKWQVFDDEAKANMAQTASFIKQYGGYMKVTLNLPVKADSSNATTVSNNGKTLEWDLLSLGEEGTIMASFSLINMPLIIILSVIAVVLLVALIVILVVVGKQKKKKNTPPTEVVSSEQSE